MLTYDPAWNKNQRLATLELRSEKGVVRSQQFIDQPGFHAAQAYLIQQRERWHESDQFRGRPTLEIRVRS